MISTNQVRLVPGGPRICVPPTLNKRSPPLTIEDIFELLRKLFPASHSFRLARERFNARSQKEGESVLQYFSDISNLSNMCEYGHLREELVRDKLIMT